jgi:hypothetical protein
LSFLSPFPFPFPLFLFFALLLSAAIPPLVGARPSSLPPLPLPSLSSSLSPSLPPSPSSESVSSSFYRRPAKDEKQCGVGGGEERGGGSVSGKRGSVREGEKVCAVVYGPAISQCHSVTVSHTVNMFISCCVNYYSTHYKIEWFSL